MITSYSELIGLVKEAGVVGSCAAVLGWDERTMMPVAAAPYRGQQMAIIARLSHEMYTHPRIGELLSQCEASTLTDEQRANVREIRRGYDRATKVPKELVQELAQVTSEAQSVWQKAKETNDFASFRPWLEKIVVLKRREADCVGYTDSRYDALVDEFEVGTRTTELKVLFASLAKQLAPLVAEIVAKSRKPTPDISKREFPIAIQEQVSRERAAAFGFDFQCGRLDVTSHPFCTGINPGDCRILTRYDVHHPMESFFGTLHETGHGLYEQGLPADHWGTPLGSAASFGIHESQSRLWENMIGRSRAFWRGYYPQFQKLFAPALDDLSVDEFWRIVNDVRPSLIRIDADEATYNLHIILRFELELALLAGDLQPADLPGAWNDKIRQYLNLTVPDDSHGCLQDIHWSFGGIGYFPTYTLGNLYAAQFLQAIERDLPSLWHDVEAGQFAPLRDWLRANIHCHGQRYRAQELCERVTSRPLSPQPFLDYLRTKFLGS
jgi:carboxypeptidase Taq